MTITTYAELKVAIVDYGKRKDASNLLDTFIDLTESDIWEKLRVREMEYLTTLTTSTSDRFVSLPADYVKTRSLKIIVNSERLEMEPRTVDQLQIVSSVGIPRYYAVTSQLEMNRTSDTAYSLELQYYRQLTALSNSNTTNDILTYYPMVYLSGCLKHFFDWADKPEKSQYWESKFLNNISNANFESRKGRYTKPQKIIRGMVV